MYRIIMMDGTEMAVVDKVEWIKIGQSGSYTPAKGRGDAIGIAYKSVAYNLHGFDLIPEAETVMVVEIDAGEYVKEISKNTANIDYISMMADIDLPEDEPEPEPDPEPEEEPEDESDPEEDTPDEEEVAEE